MYAATTKDAAQHSRWTFYEAVKSHSAEERELAGQVLRQEGSARAVDEERFVGIERLTEKEKVR